MSVENITDKVIGEYFQFKDEARLVQDVSSAIQLANRYETKIDINQLSLVQPTALRKVLVRAYFDQQIADRDATEKTHFELMVKKTDELADYLRRSNFRGALWVGGSFANGKPNGIYSDLDLYFGLDILKEDGEAWKALGNLSEIGIIMSDKSKAEKNINEVAMKGKGVARINAMTTSGIDVDIHCLGKSDLDRIAFLYPGRIGRLEPVEPYTQIRTDFIGKRKERRVEASFIENYFVENVSVKGIYLDNLSAGGVLIYETDGFGTRISNSVWKAIVKGYLFHNGAYVQNEQGKVVGIDTERASFSGFLRTLYYPYELNYSENRLNFLQTKYAQTVSMIADKYHLKQEQYGF